MADTPEKATSAPALARQETVAVLEDPPLPPLTRKQEAFVEYYCVHLNASLAAVKAGYSPHTAKDIGANLLAQAHIVAAIERQLAFRRHRTKMEQDSVINEVAVIAFSNIGHYKIDLNGDVEVDELAPPNVMAAVKSIKKRIEDTPTGVNITTEIVLWDKPTALKTLGKHIGIRGFDDKLEITGKDGGPIEVAANRLNELTVEELQARLKELTSEVVDAESVKAPDK